MGMIDGLRSLVLGGGNSGHLSPKRDVTRGDPGFEKLLNAAIEQGGPLSLHGQAIMEVYKRYQYDGALQTPLISALQKASSSSGMIGVNDYGIKGRRQYAAERRRLLDLYAIVMNNGDLRTATTHLRNEIFRRGLEWEPAFEFKCPECDEEYTAKHAKRLKYRCDCREDGAEFRDYDGKGRARATDDDGRRGVPMRKPNKKEIDLYNSLTDRANYFGQSFESILRSCEDDLNTVDDAFIYMRISYEMSDYELEAARENPFDLDSRPDTEVINVFRLDPTLVEFDMDDRGIPGQAHHLCVFHRDSVLDVPTGQGWDAEWKGICPECGLRTYPVYYKYSEMQSNAYAPGRPQALYLLENEVIHWSRYSPSETYGYPPVLSIYEKAMTLIGMDRYLYDYFYERRVPQGVVTVVTDDVVSFEATKQDLEARMQQDPHYIPWVAIASKSGQGKMEFVRFAYSLDELDYLPVRDEIRERVAGLYGVSQIWMQSTEGIGGLNNESQQLTVMSRVVEGAQRSYHTDVFPLFEKALGVRDWHLKIRMPEETNELIELQIMQTKATVAQMMAGMGFGVEWDSEDEVFSFTGRILSMEEQQEQQMKAGNPFGAGDMGAFARGGMSGAGMGALGGGAGGLGGVIGQTALANQPEVGRAGQPPRPPRAGM